jgi:hypothetical protein
MRNRLTWVLAAVLLGTLLVPGETAAKRILLLGSVRVDKVTPGGPVAPEDGELTGLAVIMNPGLEKTMAQQLPPYTIPVFVDVDNGGGPNLDTLLALTNTTAAPLEVQVTLYDRTGTVLGTRTVTLAGHATESFPVSSLVP